MTIVPAVEDLLNKGLDDLRKEVNHMILLIDEKKIYHFRPSKCPDTF